MSKEFKIGLVVVSAIFMLYWGGNYLSGSNVFKPSKDFYAIYDNVDGLLVSNEVRYNGFKVGRVNEIKYIPENGRWMVTFSVTEESLKFKEGTFAYIASADILGTMIVQLDSLHKGVELAQPGDTLVGAMTPGLQEAVDQRIQPLVHKIENLIGSVDSVIGVVSLILDDKTRRNIKMSMEKIPLAVQNILHATEVTDTIVNQLERARVQDVINNVASFTQTLKENEASLTHIIKNFESISDSLAKANVKRTIVEVNRVLAKTDTIMSKISKGEGSLGMLINDPQLYNDLVYATADLDFLLRDLRHNPKKYVNISLFGGGKRDKGIPTRDTTELRKQLDPVILKLIRQHYEEMEKKATQDSSEQSMPSPSISMPDTLDKE